MRHYHPGPHPRWVEYCCTSCTAACEACVRPHKLPPLKGASWCCLSQQQQKWVSERLGSTQVHTGPSSLPQQGRPGHHAYMDMNA